MLDAALLSEFGAMLDETCGKEAGDERDAGVVLLASAHVGGDASKVAEALGWDVARVKPFAKRLVENGVWRKDGKVAVDWANPEDGGISFACDVNVALGYMGRANTPRR